MKLFPSFLLFLIHSPESIVPGIRIWFTLPVVFNTSVGGKAWRDFSVAVTGKALQGYIILLLSRRAKIPSTGPKLTGPADQQQDAIYLQDSVEIQAKSSSGLDWRGSITLCPHAPSLHQAAVVGIHMWLLESPDHPSPSRRAAKENKNNNKTFTQGMQD